MTDSPSASVARICRGGLLRCLLQRLQQPRRISVGLITLAHHSEAQCELYEPRHPQQPHRHRLAHRREQLRVREHRRQDRRRHAARRAAHRHAGHQVERLARPEQHERRRRGGALAVGETKVFHFCRKRQQWQQDYCVNP